MAQPMDPTDPEAPAGPEDDAQRKKRLMIIGAGVAAAVLIVGAIFLFTRDDDDEDVATVDTTTSTTTESTTTTTTTTTAPPETTTTTAPTTTAPSNDLSAQDAAFVIWPAPTGETRFAEPVAAATSFATDLVGFADPLVGAFQQGDSRSGEIEVQAVAQGATTTVLVRQYGPDDSWWVIGAVTADIEIDTPEARSSIDDPVRVSGRARAFEGTVQVSVFADGSTEPIGRGFVTGRGDGVLGAFDEEISWTNPGSGSGSVILYSQSGQDGSVWNASAVRVTFAGG